MPVFGKGGFLTLDMRSPFCALQVLGPIIEIEKKIDITCLKSAFPKVYSLICLFIYLSKKNPTKKQNKKTKPQKPKWLIVGLDSLFARAKTLIQRVVTRRRRDQPGLKPSVHLFFLTLGSLLLSVTRLQKALNCSSWCLQT